MPSWLALSGWLFAALVAIGAIVALRSRERHWERREAAMRRELDFRREQARFEGLDKRLTTVWRR